MANARFAWGIDIGNRALKAVKLVPEGTGYRIDDFDVIEHETVLSNAGDNKESLVQNALATFAGRHGTKGGVAAIGVSGQSSFARFIKLPPVETKKIPEIVRFEAIQQIPFPLEEVEWSYQLFQQPDSPDVEVGIFAMRKELVNRNIQYYSDVDMNVQVVQMNPLAVYNAMYFDGRIDGTTMIIDLGAENADLIIAEGESIWLRSIPIGGNNFTEALVKAFKVNFAKAEELKRTAATSKYQRQIFQAMRPVFADLVGEVQRSIGFYASVHRESRISKVIALGGTFRLPTLQKYLQQNLQVNVERVDTFGAGAPADPKTAGMFNENILSCTAAYGLALQAMGEGKISSSLLPETIRREKMWKDKTKWFALAAGLLVAATGVKMATVQAHKMALNSTENQEHVQRITTVSSEAKNLDKLWSEVESSGAAERQLITQIASLQKYRLLWKNLLVDVAGISASAKPQPELLSGDPEQIKAIPRTERRQIFVESMNSRYEADLKKILSASDEEFQREGNVGGGLAVAAGPGMGGGAGQGGPPPEVLAQLAARGIVIPGMAMPSGGAAPAPVQKIKTAEEVRAEAKARGTGGKKAAGAPTAAAAAAPAAAVNQASRGFVVTVQCTTPQGVEFVHGTALAYLLSIDQKSAYPDRGYYVARAAITSVRKVGSDAGSEAARKDSRRTRTTPRRDSSMDNIPDIARAMMAQRGVAPGRGGGRTYEPTSPAEPDQVAADPWQDPVTGESRRDDLAVTIVFVVVIDPPKVAEQTTASAG